MKDRLDLWQGKFGDDYHERNFERNVIKRRRWLENVLARTEREVGHVVEFGCGTGVNLKAIYTLAPETKLVGIEPNHRAANVAMAHGDIIESDAAHTPLQANHFDLSITCGLLIHIPPAGLSEVMAEIYRVTGHYILCAEYFAPSEEAIPYRGETAAMWRRDYGSLWGKQFPALKYVTHGFLWQPVDGLDNLTWWLFEK